MLEGFGIAIDQVTSTTQALNRLLGRSFDLVLSDMHRDGRSDAGMELLARLRESECPVPVVFYMGKMNDTQGVPVGAFGSRTSPNRCCIWCWMSLNVRESTRDTFSEGRKPAAHVGVEGWRANSAVVRRARESSGFATSEMVVSSLGSVIAD